MQPRVRTQREGGYLFDAALQRVYANLAGLKFSIEVSVWVGRGEGGRDRHGPRVRCQTPVDVIGVDTALAAE